MSLDSLLTQTAVITRRILDGNFDRYGNLTTIETTSVVACHLQQSQRSESGAVQQARWNLWVPADTELAGADGVTVDGVAYELDGPPWLAVHPRTGEVSHIEATLVEITDKQAAS